MVQLRGFVCVPIHARNLDDATKLGVAPPMSILADSGGKATAQKCWPCLAPAWSGYLHGLLMRTGLAIERKSKITDASTDLDLLLRSDSRTGDDMAEPVNSAETQRRPDPNEKLVKVFDSEEESEAMVVKGLLESAGIDSDLTSASLVQDMFPGLGGMIILVREEDADAARQMIADYKQ